ncbi:MAG: VOC family protein [Desulfarculales bacterium]|jgi:catechol 2,3-dioxygenase-like lactoylglutathione lyase family enzyme|nr:VOC family protein [Desulfarculales bacterium]
MFSQHHLHIRCLNLPASRDFYVKVLGAEELRHYRTAYGMEIIFLRLNDTSLALSPSRKISLRSDPEPPGIYQLAFKVDNMEDTLISLRARGAKIKGPVREPSPGVKAAFLEAPDGVEIELMQF